jgi:hypothetical protein
MSRHEISRILRKFVLCQQCSQMIQVSGPDHEQKDATGDLQQSVKTFQDYANLKNLVESSCWLESHLVVLRELDR